MPALRITKARLLAIAVLLATALCSTWLIPRLRIVTSITHFLPDAEDKRAARLMRALAESELSSSLVLDLSGAPTDVLVIHAQHLVKELESSPDVKSARSGLREDAAEKIFTALLPSAISFLPASAFEAPEISRRLTELKALLGSPLGPMVRALAPEDPLGGLYDVMNALRHASGRELVTRDGVLLSEDQTHAFVFVVSRADAFDAPAQRRVISGIEAAYRRGRTQDAELLEMSGVARFAVASEAQIRGDIERIGTISTLGILVFFAIVFRSVRMLFLSLLPLFFGSALALVVATLVFGEVHGITVAFGTSLLGVGIDYTEHYFVHFSLSPAESPNRTMQKVWPGLYMGAITTVIGLVGLGFTSFPGIRELALFSSVAIFGALLGTRIFLPPFMPQGYRRPVALGRLADLAEGLLARFDSKRALLGLTAAMVLCSLASLGVTLTRTRFSDDVSVLASVEPALLAEDTRVRSRVSGHDPGRFVVVTHPNLETALDALSTTTAALERARADGLLESYVPLGALLRPKTSQQESFRRAHERQQLLRDKMTEVGFRPEAFAPLWARLAESPPTPVTLDTLLASPLAPLVAPLTPMLPEGRAFIVPVGGVKDVSALRARLGDLAILLDETSLLESTYARVRKDTVRMVLVGVVLVFLVIVARYRSLRISLAAIVPALLACLCTAGILALFGASLNLLHLVALLLVLSMGVDYGIFVVEGRHEARSAGEALVSILTATITTLLSFGLLAMSKSPALSALGTTITLGISLSLLFCPAALVLWARPEKT